MPLLFLLVFVQPPEQECARSTRKQNKRQRRKSPIKEREREEERKRGKKKDGWMGGSTNKNAIDGLQWRPSPIFALRVLDVHNPTTTSQDGE